MVVQNPPRAVHDGLEAQPPNSDAGDLMTNSAPPAISTLGSLPRVGSHSYGIDRTRIAQEPGASKSTRELSASCAGSLRGQTWTHHVLCAAFRAGQPLPPPPLSFVLPPQQHPARGTPRWHNGDDVRRRQALGERETKGGANTTSGLHGAGLVAREYAAALVGSPSYGAPVS